MKTYDETIASVHTKIEAENRRVAARNKAVTRGVATLSCLCLAAIAGIGIFGSGILNRTAPITTATEVPSATKTSEPIPTPTVPATIIYSAGIEVPGQVAPDNTAKTDPIEQINLFSPPEPGKLTFLDSLTKALAEEHGENDLFAVGLNFGMLFHEPQDEEYRALTEQIRPLLHNGKVRYYTHLDEDKEHHPTGVDSPLCEICHEIRAQYDRDLEEARKLEEKADAIWQSYVSEFNAERLATARAYIASLGFNAKELTVKWDELYESGDVIFILHLTESEIRSIKPHESDEVGISLDLIPEWMDAEGTVVYHMPINNE